MPLPQVSRCRPKTTRIGTTPRLFPASRTMYCATASRTLSLIIVLMFIPLVAIPVGETDLVIAMTAGVGISVLWDFYAIVHQGYCQRCVPWPLAVTFDVIIIPTTLIVFAASAYIDGIAPEEIPDAEERSIMALVLFVLTSGLHLLSAVLELKLYCSRRTPTLTTNRPRLQVSATPTRTSRPSRPSSTSQSAARPDDPYFMWVMDPEDALMKQRAEERSGHRGRSQSLPRYSAADPAGVLPPYDNNSHHNNSNITDTPRVEAV